MVDFAGVQALEQDLLLAQDLLLGRPLAAVLLDRLLQQRCVALQLALESAGLLLHLFVLEGEGERGGGGGERERERERERGREMRESEMTTNPLEGGFEFKLGYRVI